MPACGNIMLMNFVKSQWKYALVIIGLLVLAYLVMDFNSRMSELRRLSVEKEIVAAQVTQLRETQSSLKTPTSDSAVADWAYAEGHMVRPGDNPVVPVAPGDVTPVPTPTQVVARPVVRNWQMWLWLFVEVPPGRGLEGAKTAP
jgi:hypothetical protein